MDLKSQKPSGEPTDTDSPPAPLPEGLDPWSVSFPPNLNPAQPRQGRVKTGENPVQSLAEDPKFRYTDPGLASLLAGQHTRHRRHPESRKEIGPIRTDPIDAFALDVFEWIRAYRALYTFSPTQGVLVKAFGHLGKKIPGALKNLQELGLVQVYHGEEKWAPTQIRVNEKDTISPARKRLVALLLASVETLKELAPDDERTLVLTKETQDLMY